MEHYNNPTDETESLNDTDLEKKFGFNFCLLMSHEFVRKHIRLVDEGHKVGESREKAVNEVVTAVTSNDEVISDQTDEFPAVATTEEMHVESEAFVEEISSEPLDASTVLDSIQVRKNQLKCPKLINEKKEKANVNVVEITLQQSQASERTISSTDPLALPEFPASNDADLLRKDSLDLTKNQVAVGLKQSRAIHDFSNGLLPVSHSSSHSSKRLPYTDEEDRQIVEYIIRTDRFLDVKGNALYKDMEREGVNYPRSWSSMRDHFIKSIAPKIKNNAQRLNLDQQDMKKILFATKKVRQNVLR